MRSAGLQRIERSLCDDNGTIKCAICNVQREGIIDHLTLKFGIWESIENLTKLKLLFRALLRGGGGTIYSNGVFVQTILADRYILVPLEGSSSVEQGIKKNFLIFVFYRELLRYELLRKEEGISFFLFTISGIFA